MSLKVWEAYRLKDGEDLWEVLHDIRVRAENKARKTLRGYYAEFVKNCDTPQKRRHAAEQMWPLREGADAKAKADHEEFLAKVVAGKWGVLEASDFFRRKYREQRATAERNVFDFDVAVAVRRKGRRYYIIPYPGSGMLSDTLTFLRRHPALEDYHYQNQTDRPDNIPAAEWRERKKVWHWLTEDERWDDKLVLDIVTVDGWTRVDPWAEYFVKGLRKMRRRQARKA